MSDRPLLDTPVPISVTWAEARRMSHTAMHASVFRSDEQYGRFEATSDDADDARETTSVPDRLIAAPEFDHGTFLWCESYIEALCVARVHQAHGYLAHILWDTVPNPDPSWVVLTSHNYEDDNHRGI